MKIILNKKTIKDLLKKEKNVGFVPTMGGIHPGHISLIKKSIKQCRKTVVSIFVNKHQFNRINDYKNYPRPRKEDILKIKSFKVDYLYLPQENELYPNGRNKKIKISSFSKKLCGKFRPGHFEAVVDVVKKFLNIINPTKIYLGEKDMQQLKIIEDYINKNKIKTRVVSCKTIREKNGLAYSSRNYKLSEEKRNIGSNIYKLILKNKSKLINSKFEINKMKNKIITLGADKIDYLEILNVNKIIKPYKKQKKYKIFISYYLNKIRLIDNI